MGESIGVTFRYKDSLDMKVLQNIARSVDSIILDKNKLLFPDVDWSSENCGLIYDSLAKEKYPVRKIFESRLCVLVQRSLDFLIVHNDTGIGDYLTFVGISVNGWAVADTYDGFIAENKEPVQEFDVWPVTKEILISCAKEVANIVRFTQVELSTHFIKNSESAGCSNVVIERQAWADLEWID